MAVRVKRFACLSCLVLFAHAGAMGSGPQTRPSPGAAPESQGERKGTAALVGRVVDASGAPVGDAVVTLSGGFEAIGASILAAPIPGGPRRTLTSATGYFAFFDLPAGSYSIEAAKPGFLPGAYGRERYGGPAQSIVLADGEHQTQVSFAMWEFATIGGRIVDEAGQPMVGIRVRALPRVIDAGRWRWDSNALPGLSDVTDDRGAYRLDAVPPGEYLVAIPSASMTSPGVFALPPGSEIPRYAPAGLVYPTTFYPQAPSMSAAHTVVVRSGEERFGTDIQMTPLATTTVAGTVTGPDGPLPGQLVRLLPEEIGQFTAEREFAFEAVAATDAGGRFTIEGVPPGRYLLDGSPAPAAGRSVGADRRELFAAMPVVVGADGVSDVAFVITGGMTVSGRVEFDGALPKPGPTTIQRFFVRLEPADAYAQKSVTRFRGAVDASGAFRILDVPPGRYVVKFQASAEDRRAMDGWESVGAVLNGRDVSTRPMDVQSNVSGVVLRLSDRAGRLTGTARDSRGEPDSAACVLLFTTDRDVWVDSGTTNRRLRAVRASEDGSFVIPVVHSGEYYLAAIPDADAALWNDPQRLDAIARTARRIRFGDYERKTIDVTTQVVR